MSYVVKNCPAYNNENYAECNSDYTEHLQCFHNDNCLIKQIIEKCKAMQLEFDDNLKNGNYQEKFKWFKAGRADAGNELLKLFDIQEVD